MFIGVNGIARGGHTFLLGWNTRNIKMSQGKEVEKQMGSDAGGPMGDRIMALRESYILIPGPCDYMG